MSSASFQGAYHCFQISLEGTCQATSRFLKEFEQPFSEEEWAFLSAEDPETLPEPRNLRLMREALLGFRELLQSFQGKFQDPHDDPPGTKKPILQLLKGGKKEANQQTVRGKRG